MQPRFRSDLKSAREEQQGVVFYRIDDPLTQTSFRLYEIEFLIAQKLDGKRGLEQVIGAVKSEYNFDISEPDLKKFISQLESMGFIQASDKAAASPAPAPAEAPSVPSPPDDSPESIHDEVTSPGIPEFVPAAASPPPPPADAGLDIDDAVAAELDPDATNPAYDGQPLDDIVFDGAEDEGIPTTPGLETGVEAVTEAPLGDGIEDDVQVVAASDFDPRRSTASPEEVVRMIATACEHLRQGYVVHARDYFLAAGESREDDEKLGKMIAELQLAGDDPDTDVVRKLQALAGEIFPDLAGDMADGEALESDDDDFLNEEGEENLRSRLLWVFVLLFVIAGGIVALYFVATYARIFEGTAQVDVRELEAGRLPAYFPDSAESVSPNREEWLEAGGAGKVIEVPEPGTQVKKGDILLMLQLHPRAKKKLDKARAEVRKADGAYDKAAAKLSSIVEEQEGVKTERNDAESKLKELRPKSILKGGGVSKRDLEKYKKILAQANKKLGKLKKKERKPRQQEKKAKAKVEAARRKLDKMLGSIASKLITAPYPGVVAEVKTKKGATVEKGAELIFFKDPLAARLVFVVPDAGNLQPGGEAHISVDFREPGTAKVLALDKGGDGVSLEIKLPDPAGAFVEMEPAAFRLVREFVEPAFSVDTSALAEDPETGVNFVFIAIQGQAVRREVELLSRNPNKSSVRSPSGSLRNGDLVIIAFPGANGVNDLLENASVDPKKIERE